MATSYPLGIDNFTNPSANDYEDVVSHSGQHSNANDAIEAIETTLGTTAGTAVLKNLSAGDFAAKTANETFSGTTSFAEIDIGSSTVVDEVLDEDDMASDSATALATQQSIKAMHDTGWTAITETLTYASATTITVAAGAESRYQKGDKLKITQTTDKYFYIVGVADTVLTVAGGTTHTLVSAEITSPHLSRIEKPFGFPDYFSWDLNPQGFSTVSKSGRFSIHGNDVFILCSINGTSNATSLTFSLPVICASATETLAPISYDNGAVGNSPTRIAFGAGSTVATAYKTINGAAWTASGNKRIDGVTAVYKF